MNFTHLKQHYQELLDYLREEGYTESYIRLVRQDIGWILKNEDLKSWQSYIDIYRDRICKSESEFYKKNHRIAFGAIQQFDLYSEFPNRKAGTYLIKRGAYHKLLPEFKDFINIYKESAKLSGLKERTIYGNASGASVFLYAMQGRKIRSLASISEEDVLSFFVSHRGLVWKESRSKPINNHRFLLPTRVQRRRAGRGVWGRDRPQFPSGFCMQRNHPFVVSLFCIQF